MPDRVTVIDEASLVWETPAPAGDSWPGTDNLLDHFCELESAHPEEMADFLRWYGLPELCFEHGRPDHHTEGEYCPLTTGDTWTSLSVRHLRIAARAYSAIRRGSARLAIRPATPPRRSSTSLRPSPTGSGIRPRRITHPIAQP